MIMRNPILVLTGTSLGLVLLTGCTQGENRFETVAEDSTDATTSCSSELAAFENYSDQVSADCDGDYLHIHSPNGLPDQHARNDAHQSMVGITAWINRVPIPYTYDWMLPRDPIWLHQYEEASARGPIAVAVNGVPIFHLDPRPDVSTDPGLYDPEYDTVQHGELDQCGGHAGQGDDYHYHYAPVCLLDNHELTLPIAYGLDGIPMYFGTGGTDYYGSGRFNDVNNLPESDLDECNAVQLEDGSYVYYTTDDAPYTIGCHRGYVDESLRIEPRPLTGRDQGLPVPEGPGYFGEPIDTLVTQFYLDEEEQYHLQYVNGDSTGEVIYHLVGGTESCWEFEYRAESNTTGTVERYCRGN